MGEDGKKVVNWLGFCTATLVFFQITLISQVHANSAIFCIFQHFSQKIDSGRGLTDEYIVKGSPTSHFFKRSGPLVKCGKI